MGCNGLMQLVMKKRMSRNTVVIFNLDRSPRVLRGFSLHRHTLQVYGGYEVRHSPGHRRVLCAALEKSRDDSAELSQRRNFCGVGVSDDARGGRRFESSCGCFSGLRSDTQNRGGEVSLIEKSNLINFSV